MSYKWQVNYVMKLKELVRITGIWRRIALFLLLFLNPSKSMYVSNTFGLWKIIIFINELQYCKISFLTFYDYNYYSIILKYYFT